MKNNKYQLNILGNSYLSYIVASHLIGDELDVTILNDPSFGMGENYGNLISELDKSFFHTWGKDKNLVSLQNLNEYLTPMPVEFRIDDIQVCFGRTPSLNLIEMLRKIPSFFKGLKDKDKLIKDIIINSHQFDESYYNFCHLVGANIFRYKTFQNLVIEDFLVHCPDSIKKIYEVFIENWFENISSMHQKDETKKALMYLWRSVFQNKISIKTSEFEVFHLFLTMLGQTYRIDQDAFKKSCKKNKAIRTYEGEVLDIHQSFGNVRNIHHSSEKEAIDLNQLFIICSGPPENMVEIERLHPGYCSTLLRIKNFAKYQFLQDKVYVYARSCDFGTRMPFWLLYKNNDELWVSANLKKEDASKIDFDIPFIKEKIKNDFNFFYPHKNLDPDFIDQKRGNDFYYQESDWQNFSRTQLAYVPVSKKFKILDKRKHRFVKINNSNYFGPLRNGPLGLLSLLMELKDCHKLVSR